MSAMGGRLDGLTVMDLFAGSGALGLECLSRGAAHVTFVEKAGSSLKTLRRNVEALGAGDRCTIVQGDVFAWLGDLSPSLCETDVALADPPYGQGFAERLVERYLLEPFAKALWVEHAVRDPVPEAPGLRQRRYGDTMLSHLQIEP